MDVVEVDGVGGCAVDDGSRRRGDPASESEDGALRPAAVELGELGEPVQARRDPGGRKDDAQSVQHAQLRRPHCGRRQVVEGDRGRVAGKDLGRVLATLIGDIFELCVEIGQQELLVQRRRPVRPTAIVGHCGLPVIVRPDTMRCQRLVSAIIDHVCLADKAFHMLCDSARCASGCRWPSCDSGRRRRHRRAAALSCHPKPEMVGGAGDGAAWGDLLDGKHHSTAGCTPGVGVDGAHYKKSPSRPTPAGFGSVVIAVSS